MNQFNNINYLYDEIYGCYPIDCVLFELINNAKIQRLKNIHQSGAGFLVNESWNVTRYEHSVGVMLLIKKLGGTLSEQISGLFHDVAHTAFSHLIDYIVNNLEENYHETITKKIYNDKDLKQIFYKYKIDIINTFENDFSILNADLPSLSVDRIDYTLRDMYRAGIVNKNEINEFLNSLMIFDNTLCLKSIDAGDWFSKLYYKEVINFFMHPLNIFANQKMKHLCCLALEKKILFMEDFMLDDNYVIKKLLQSKDDKIIKLFYDINQYVTIIEDEFNYDFHTTFKPRIIDPNILHKGQIKRLTELSQSAKERNANSLAYMTRGSYIAVHQ